MSSLPASWHSIGVKESKPVNQVTPLKRPRSIKLGPPTNNHISVKKNILTPTSLLEKPKKPNTATTFHSGGPLERKTWTQRPKFDPSHLKNQASNVATPSNLPSTTQTIPKTNGLIKDSNRLLRNTKPRMPTSTMTTKARAKSAGNNQELKARTQEDTNMEIMLLRKELAHARDENTLLKGKLRRTEEDLNKKIKNLEKQLVAAKKDCSGIEKKKESTNETIAVLKQKCQKLEIELKTKDQSLRKLEANMKTASMANGTLKSPSTVPSKPVTLRQAAASAPLTRASPKTNQAINTELNKTKDSLKKLEQENTNLKQKLKDKDQEIKTLKVHLSKAQKIPSTIVRASLGSSNVSSATSKPTAYSPIAGNILTKTTTRVSRTSLHRTSATGTRMPVISTAVTKSNENMIDEKGKNGPVEHLDDQTGVLTITDDSNQPLNGIPAAITPKSNDNSSRSKEKAHELQRKSAARKIQRSWRHHRERVKKSDEFNNGTENFIVYQAAEHIEISSETPEFIPEVPGAQHSIDLKSEHEGIDLLNFGNQGYKSEETLPKQPLQYEFKPYDE